MRLIVLPLLAQAAVGSVNGPGSEAIIMDNPVIFSNDQTRKADGSKGENPNELPFYEAPLVNATENYQLSPVSKSLVNAQGSFETVISQLGYLEASMTQNTTVVDLANIDSSTSHNSTTVSPSLSSTNTTSTGTPSSSDGVSQVTESSSKLPTAQEALPVKDTSYLVLSHVQRLIKDEDYSDVFASPALSAMDSAEKFSDYLNSSVTQQSNDEPIYAESLKKNNTRSFLYTGNAKSRTSKNCYVLRTNDSISVGTKGKVKNVLEAMGGIIRYDYNVPGLSGFAVCFPEKQLPIALLRSITGLDWVERDQYSSLNFVQDHSPWDLAYLNNPELGLSDAMAYSFNATGSGVNVYVIDSGVMTEHPEFSGRAKVGYSAFENFPEDCAGHGTQVSSVIAGLNVGVAKQANIIVAQVLDCDGQGENSAVLAALSWIVENHKKPAVINMSVGGPKSVSVDEAVKAAVNAGVAVVVAAGNSQIDACSLSPSGVESAMVVGASTYDLKRADFSNYGMCVEVFAPGQHVVAAALPAQATTNGFTFVSGTSLSAPLVTGIYALLLQVHPTATPPVLKQLILDVAAMGVLDKNTLLGSPNLLVQVPMLPVTGSFNANFLPPGVLPVLKMSSSSSVELILILVGAGLVLLFAILAIIVILRRRYIKRQQAIKSTFQ